ncbi:MAG: DUF4347 domain-containing protein [Gammaproteobacteria bacterium]|nr:DUF4347 domain-containing protein [Gammaproteobacteria bacterium]
MLLSADAFGAFASNAVYQDVEQPDDESVQLNESDQLNQTDAADHQSRELIIIDASTPDYEQLLADLTGSAEEDRIFEVAILDATENGIDQITDLLADRDDLDAVHLISHGEAGSIMLGNTVLDYDTLIDNARDIEYWGDALTEDGDVLIYGCNLAATEEGQDLVDALARLTETDVAASEDLTGAESLGGDWDLEYQQGEIQTSLAISDGAQDSWSNVLANFTVDTTADTFDANPGNGLAEDGSGNTSLRAAVEEANALGGADTITLGAGNFELSEGRLEISSDISIVGAGAGQTVIDAKSLSRVFAITSGTVSISGVTLQNGDAGAGDGGGVHIANNAVVTMTEVLLTGHGGHFGGAIWNDGALTLDRATLDLNNASYGGGLYTRGTATITNSTISNNTAINAGVGEGGGIWTSGAGNTLDLTNVTISGNSTDGDGGGVYNGNDASLINVTITDNQAVQGAGIHDNGNPATTTLTNTIVAGNGTPGQQDLSGNYASGGNNLIGINGPSSGLTDGVNGDQVGTSGSPLDPLLGSLADNGGFAQTHALQAGSSAIDAANNALAPVTDQTGSTRDGAADIGAFEYGGVQPVSIQSPWTNVAVSTDRSTTISSPYTVTAAPGSDRLLIVTMVTRFGNDQTIDVTTATFGGVELHEIVEGSSTTTRNGVWMGYLLDSEILAGSQTLSVSFTSTVSDPTGTKLLAATYVGVDQTTPINDSSANNTKADAPITFGSQIDHVAGGEVVYVASFGGNTNTNTTEPAGFSKIYTNEWSGLLMTTIGHMDDTTSAGNSAASTAVDFEGTDANHSLAVVALNPTATNLAPEITSNGGGATASINVDENTTTVTTVTATDADLDILTYSIDPASDDDGFFSIDSGTGVLSFTAAPDFAAPADLNGDNIYEITVQVSDGKGGTDSQALAITVTPVNDAPTDLSITSTTSGGLSLNEDGGNDVYFVADDGGALLGGLNTVTIETTFSVTPPVATYAPILSYADGANDEELAILIEGDGTIRFGASSNGSPLQDTVGNYTQLLDGEIHHLAVSWDSSTGAVDFYIDGALAESFTGYQTGQTLTGGGELVFGQDQDSVLGGFSTNEVFSGKLYDVRIFDDVRTAGEIAASYDQTLANTEPGMIANWTFGDLSTDGIITDSVSGNNLSLQHVVGAGFTASTPELSLSVAENAPNLTVIGSLAAIDPDAGDTFTYTLLNDAGGRFSIDSSSGEISVLDTSLIDFESATSHDITVRATDSGALT